MRITIQSAETAARSCAATDWFVQGLFDDEGATDFPRPTLAEYIDQLFERKEAPGALGEALPIFRSDPKEPAVLLVGLGKREEFGPGPAYAAGFAASKKLAGKLRPRVLATVPPAVREPAILQAWIEGLVVGLQGPGIRKSEPSRFPFGELIIMRPARFQEREFTALVNHAEVGAAAVNLARELVETPPNDKTPAILAERMAAEAYAAGLGAEIWDADRIATERFGGLLGVAAGSQHPPAFLVLHYLEEQSGPVHALVGKGVTFDSGGLSLKPSASMEDMKCDMTGAAVVLSAMTAVARLRLPVRMRGYLALTENMTGGQAMKLGDVLTLRNRTTVEILNTDAEGRLILADALAYASESQPARIIDLATLTGACMTALGTKIAGLFSEDAGLVADLSSAAKNTGERVWQLPLDADFAEGLKSKVADLKNVGGKYGGAITAAKFLQAFVGSTPWAHLDIAGPSWSEDDGNTRDRGATGCFVRTLIRYARDRAAEGTGAAP
jgi:leucyl aminopeptidase